jgi:hypothetical protein
MFEFVHTGLPLGALAVVGGMPHLSKAQAQAMLKSLKRTKSAPISTTPTACSMAWA